MDSVILRRLLLSRRGVVPGRGRDEEEGYTGTLGFLGRGWQCLVSAGQQVPLTSWE